MGFSAVVLLFVGLVNCGVMAGIYPTCSTPSLPKNGGIQGSIQQYYSVGTVLYYSCNYGYVSHPQNSWTACRLAFSGTYWENTPPTCTRKKMLPVSQFGIYECYIAADDYIYLFSGIRWKVYIYNYIVSTYMYNGYLYKHVAYQYAPIWNWPN